MMTLWKCATRNSELWSTKSAGGTASSTPVMPPTTKVSMKATVHIIGSSKRMRPRYMVNSQLKSFAPVGIEITIVVMPKKLLTLADRKSVVSGKSVSVRVDLGGRRFIKKKKK